MTDAISGALGSLQTSLGGLVSWLRSWLDKLISPEKRAQIAAQIHQFATDRPLLAAFLASLMTFSGLPVAIYVAFCVTVTLFALIVALLVALLSALAFILMAAGFALIFLLPVAFFTTFIAVSVWGWGVGLYFLFKWAGKDEILEKVDGQLRGLLGQAPEQHDEKAGQAKSHDSRAKAVDGPANGTDKRSEKGHPKHQKPGDLDLDKSSSII